MSKEIKADSYTLRDEKGNWLGQVVLTSDGMFASVTDYGNLSFAWRSFGTNFKGFIIGLNTSYFANKLAMGMSYIHYSRKCDKACERFAEKILPALQAVLMSEMNGLKPSGNSDDK